MLTASIIIPTYNRAHFLGDAIESVLRQTCAPLEILVVDDGSTDQTQAVAERFGDRVRRLVQPNRGPAAARNLGIADARGDVIGFLDDDDVWLPDSLERGLARLQDSVAPPVSIVCGMTLRVKNLRVTEDGFQYEPIPPRAAMLSFCSALCRRDVFERVGPLDERLRLGEDVDWFLRMREMGVPFTFLPEVTHLYRLHENNVTHDKTTSGKFFLKALQQSIARRTEQNPEGVAALPEIPDFDQVYNRVHEQD